MDLEEFVDELEAPEPSPIAVGGSMSVDGYVDIHEEPCDYGSYATFVLLGTEEKQMVMGYDRYRIRGQIRCSGTGPVWVGTESQCAGVRAGNSTGYQLQTGETLLIRNKQPVWMVPDGTHPATVTVLLERFDR